MVNDPFSKAYAEGRPNPPMQPTPLRVRKIGAILISRCARMSFRSGKAARLMGNPLGRRYA